jgi:hypothetical protein
MIIVECEQGSPEWHSARAGVITASMFSTIRKKVNCLTDQQAKYVAAVRSGMCEKDAIAAAGYKAKPKADAVDKAIAGERVGDYSDAALDYAFRLAVERISGSPLDEGFSTWSMKRGHELEPEARMEHESVTGLFVERAGFIMTDDCLFGASADGLIGEDEGSEYKCFIAPEKLRAFHIDNDPSTVIDQVQGCLWITGRKRWHLGMYCPALAPVGRQLWLKTFERNEDYIEAMERDLVEFASLVSSFENELRKKAA